MRQHLTSTLIAASALLLPTMAQAEYTGDMYQDLPAFAGETAPTETTASPAVIEPIEPIAPLAQIETVQPPSEFNANFSDAETAEIENIVRNYLIANPAILQEMMYELKRHGMTNPMKINIVKQNADFIYHNPISGEIGASAADADVTLVEFIDYNCPYCRKTSQMIENLAASDPKLRVVFKEFPILAPSSRLAALAVLAAKKQGKFQELHRDLLRVRGVLSEEELFERATRVGLDVARLKIDMNSQILSDEVDQTADLAKLLQFHGTPSYIIGNQIIQGAQSRDKLYKYIMQARLADQTLRQVQAVQQQGTMSVGHPQPLATPLETYRP